MASTCPLCSAPITLTQWLFAVTPWQLKCPTCASPLRLNGLAQLVCGVYLLLAVAAILVVAFIYVTQRSIPRIAIPLTVVATMLGSVVLEALLLTTNPFVR